MKVLVTGGRGMLGTDVCDAFGRRGHDVVAVGRAEFDITNKNATAHSIREIAPQLVIHCAAYTNVDRCEVEAGDAYSVNTDGSENVALACHAIGAKMIYISTDFVFDGEKSEPYIETDLTKPLGIYGDSKLGGERKVAEVLPDSHCIVRTSWLYGVSGKCFPKTIINSAKTRPELKVVADQFGTPTFTADLADALVNLAESNAYGIFHIAGSGSCSWHEFAVETLLLAGLSHVVVQPIPSDEWPTPTRRPKYSVLRSVRLESLAIPPLREWNDALKQYVTSLAG